MTLKDIENDIEITLKDTVKYNKNLIAQISRISVSYYINYTGYSQGLLNKKILQKNLYKIS